VGERKKHTEEDNHRLTVVESGKGRIRLAAGEDDFCNGGKGRQDRGEGVLFRQVKGKVGDRGETRLFACVGAKSILGRKGNLARNY